MLTLMWDSYNPINWSIGIAAVLYVIGKDRGWRKGWRERAARETETAQKFPTA